MANNQLTPKSPLGGFCFKADGISIEEVLHRGIASVATPMNGQHDLAQAIAAHYSTSTPTPGSSTNSATDNAILLGLARDQLFLVFDDSDHDGLQRVVERLGSVAYLTDQSDSWAMLRVSGSASCSTLERICPIDLDNSVFSTGSVARTTMEHMGIIIMREATDSFVLYSAASSAKSFLHAVQVSANYVLPSR